MKEARSKRAKSSLKVKKPRRRVETSSLDVLLDKTLTIQQNGQTREVTTEEALNWIIYQDALEGKIGAVRKIVKMIQEYEAALEKKYPPKPKSPPESKMEMIDLGSHHADEALLILGIARPHEDEEKYGRFDRRQLLLEPWSVQAALSRPGGKRFDDKERQDIVRQTAEPEQLKWPKGYDPL